MRANCINIETLDNRAFRITNGCMTIEAHYVYASGSGENKVRAHWDVTEEDITTSVFKAKDDVVKDLTERLTRKLDNPLRVDEAEAMQTDHGYIRGIVELSLSDLFGLDAVTILNRMASLLTEADRSRVYDIAYKMVSLNQEDNTIRFLVTAKLNT